MVKVKKNKRSKFNKNKKIIILITTILVFIIVILIGISPFFKKNFHSNEKEVKEEQIKNNTYHYKLNNNASEYEKKLFDDLGRVLDEEVIDDEQYAVALSKLFVTDLFTLNSKKSSSDVTSLQYIYSDYQDSYKKLVKDTIYSNIELNLDGKRIQKLPIVKDVVVSSIEREAFSLNNEVLDSQAFKLVLDIIYEENMDYPTKYGIVLIKNNKTLEVVKGFEL